MDSCCGTKVRIESQLEEISIVGESLRESLIISTFGMNLGELMSDPGSISRNGNAITQLQLPDWVARRF